ncbi:Calx-beta domain-containing protein [Candidatus Albibeggiatoa sp. nov. NOAA]|uniref:Calx-beta domain-containing protein n=1 Tax=Candidatus Albibeggiatoa sp. nov. NOAA TaxID=3162724 RepID=UPI0032F65723|nr:hypothetical protein [Thiotrichaceae bacterium]
MLSHPILRILALGLIFLGIQPVVWACDASIESELSSCISGSDSEINITADITLTGTQTIDRAVTINGGNNTIQGDDSFRLLIVNASSGEVIINDIELTNGNTSGSGTTCSGGGAGGGICKEGNSNLTINRSTISNSDGMRGGGFYITSGGDLNIYNSVLTGNSATWGGGFYNRGGASINIAYSTIENNAATSTSSYSGGGFFNFASTGTVTIKSSIIINNSGLSGKEDCNKNVGTLTSLGYNLIGNTTGCPSDGTGDDDTASASDIFDTAPTLKNDASNPALDAIDNGTNDCGTSPFNVDYLGTSRPKGADSKCDIGAHELNADSTAPEFDNTETKTTNGSADDELKIIAQINEVGTVYYVILDESDGGAPSASQVEAGKDSGGTTVDSSLRGSLAISTINTATEIASITGLTAPASYTVYLVAKDDSGNVSSVKDLNHTTTDTTAPTITTTNISGIGATFFDLEFGLDELGTVYYVVVTDGSGKPTESQIAAGQNSSGSAAIASGTVSITDTSESVTETITGLSSETSYDIYFYAEDAIPNKTDIGDDGLTTIADTVAPVFEDTSPTSTIGNETGSSFDITVRLDEIGVVYYIVVADGSDNEPSQAQIKAGNDKTDSAALKSGSINVTAASTNQAVTVSGLDYNTNYDIYLYAEDDESTPNLSDVSSLTAVTVPDTTAPTFSSSSSSNITSSSVDVTVEVDESSTIYYVVVLDGATAPTATEVKNGQASGGGTPEASGNFAANASTSISETISGLSSETAYDIYLAAEDSSSNLSNTTKLDATTSVLSYTVSISKSGSGDGTTSGYGTYEPGDSVSLTATANSKSTFSGWAGDNECGSSFTMPSNNISCTAKFTKTVTEPDDPSPPPQTTYHNLQIEITGKGDFSSDQTGLKCSPEKANCFAYREYLTVTHTAEPDPGYRLKSWSGDCSTSGSVLMDGRKTCRLTFERLPAYQLITQKSGKGLGTITSNDGLINCGSACRTSYTADLSTTLTATADTDKTQFTGWSCVDGLNSTETSIEVAMSQNRTCTASFSALFSLTTSVTSTGGSISYADTLSCNAGNSPCTQNYPDGVIQLISTPDAGYVANWGAECPEGQVVLDADKTCSVSFTPSYTLSLQVIGNGSITSSPSGIDCQEGTCTASYIQGDTIQLIATSEFGHSFVGWTGDCSNGQTTLTMNSDKICTATFANTGSPQFAQDVYAITEQDGIATITVNRVEGSNGAMNITYLVGNGTAVYPNDYHGAVTGLLSWADGDVEPKTFDITIATDPITEAVETVNLQLLNQTNTVLDTAELQIGDTFLPANVNFVRTNVTASDKDQVLRFAVARSISFSGAIQTDFVVTVGENILTQGTLNWADNEIDTKLIEIPIGAVPVGESTLNAIITNPQPADVVALGSKTASTLTIKQTPVSGEINFTSALFEGAEGDLTSITIERTGATDTEAQITLTLLDGTATPTTDYVFNTFFSTLTWAAGENAVKTANVKLERDALTEETETVNLQLLNPVGTLLGANAAATLQILDATATPTTDDITPPVDPNIPITPPEPALGAVEFEQAEYAISEDAGRLTINVVRTPETAGIITVQVTSQNGSAVSGRDYVPINQQLRWVDDATRSRELVIDLIDNATADGNRTFTLELANTDTGNVVGEQSIATITIVDNDSNQVQFETDSYRVKEDAREVILTVARAGGLDAASIGYRTNSEGTAESGQDYTKTSGQLSWQAGDLRSQNITIPIINDNDVEQNETFTVGLFATDGSTQTLSPSSVTVTITDDDKERTEPVVNSDTGNTLVNGQVSNQAGTIGEVGKSTFVNVDGSISNSTLAGDIESEGVLEEVVLTAGTTITGGTIRGSVVGHPKQPAVLKNITIESGTRLDNVIIGRGSVVADDVILGDNVQFTDNTTIPALNLGRLTGRIMPPETAQTFFNVFAINLLTDVITNPSINGILGSINGLQEFIEYGVAMQQDTTYGMLVLQIDTFVYPLLPVQLSQALPNQLRDNKPYVGLHVEHNAEVAFITHTGRHVVAVPVVYAPEQFLSALTTLGLGQAVMDASGNIRIEATDTEYLSARASLLSPAVSEGEVGIQYVNSAYLPNLTEMLLTYTDRDNVLRQQAIYPAPVDNAALSTLTNNVAIYMDGRVVAKNAQGQIEYNGLLGYNIYQSVAEVSDSIQIQEIEDANLDGLLDYRLTYPNGDAQVLFRME